MKHCKYCGQDFELSFFYKDSAKCKSCHKKYTIEWYKNHPEKKRQVTKAWIAKQPAEYNLEKSRRWRELNPDKSSMQTKRRRNLMRTRFPAWGDRDKIRQIYLKARAENLTVDHIVPLVHPLVSGLHVHSNLQLMTKSENSAKCNHGWPDMPGGGV